MSWGLRHATWSCSADLFTEDGVLIQAEGETRTIDAVWTVLVVINPPRPPPMQAWVDRARRGITGLVVVYLRELASQIHNDKLAWESRLSTLLLEGSLGVGKGCATFLTEVGLDAGL